MKDKQEFEDCFEIELAISKVEHIYFINTHTLLLLHIPYQYTIVKIEDRYKKQILKHGQFQYKLIEDVKIYDHKSVLFIHENYLHLYDLYKGDTICKYEITKSHIYEQQFQFQMTQRGTDQKIVFYKTSVLKSTPITIYYDVHLLSIGSQFERIKKLKVEYQELRNFGYCSGQIFSYQMTGFTIQVHFMESEIIHKINSIFYLFLVDISIQKEQIVFNFTHEELENELTSYQVSKKKVKKFQRIQHFFEPHIYANQSKSRSIVYKNCFNHRRKDHFYGIFRIKATKQTKYLKILDEIVPESGGKAFKQEILNLLT